MEKGDIVKVYTDPVTCTDLEGEARLVKKIWGTENGRLPYWTVRFLSDGMLVDRFVNPETATTTDPDPVPDPDSSVKLWELTIDGKVQQIEAVDVKLELICTEL